jgi:hypothetical protein
MSRSAYNPEKEELFHVSGDMDHGVTATTNFNKNAAGNPQIRYSGKYGEWVMEADVYIVDGQISVHMICPRCKNALWIRTPNKEVDYDIVNDLLSCEKSQCTWELGRSDATKNDRIEFGAGLCKFTFAIDKNRAKDA